MKNLNFVLVLGAALLLAGCQSSSSGGDGGGTSGGLTLSTADMPSVTPCSDQLVLTDQTELDAFKAALTSGAYTYLDLPYNGADPDIFKKKCGLEGFWNPTDNVNPIVPANLGITSLNISQVLSLGNAGICTSSFDNGSFGTGEGFPASGTYRKEFKVAHLGSTYHARLRIVVTGSSAGNSFSNEGITTPTDIENTLVYEVDGVVTTHANVMATIIANMAVASGEAPGATIDIKKTASGSSVLNATVEFICVKKS